MDIYCIYTDHRTEALFIYVDLRGGGEGCSKFGADVDEHTPENKNP